MVQGELNSCHTEYDHAFLFLVLCNTVLVYHDMTTLYTIPLNDLAQIGIESLESRREHLCLNFARKFTKNKKLSHMFPENIKPHGMSTRHEEKYRVQFANTDRLKDSPIIYMQNLLNLNDEIKV